MKHSGIVVWLIARLYFLFLTMHYIFDIHGVRVLVKYFILFNLLNCLSFVTQFVNKNYYG
jgi:hypothetical protein